MAVGFWAKGKPAACTSHVEMTWTGRNGAWTGGGVGGKRGTTRQLLLFTSQPAQYGYTVFAIKTENVNSASGTENKDFYRHAQPTAFEHAWTEI
jgi:hypothetical protein